MKLREIVGTHNYNTITYRTNGPFEEDDVFAGACSYINGKLKPLDDDSYSLDDEIIKFEGDDNSLTVWYKSEWIYNDDVNVLYVANRLNNNKYGDELHGISEKYLEEKGIVVVFGYSDDNIEFRGVIDDELGCFDGGLFHVTKHGVISDDNYSGPNYIDARWFEEVTDDLGRISWTYETDIKHETFMLYDEGEPWCRGLVFSINNLVEE